MINYDGGQQFLVKSIKSTQWHGRGMLMLLYGQALWPSENSAMAHRLKTSGLY